MSDFHQTGCVTTLHRLTGDGTARLEAGLRQYAESRPIGLILPALYSEFETPAMRGIVEELAEVDYVRHIVVALGRATHEQLQLAQECFAGFSRPVTFLWLDGPRMQNLFRLLDDHGLSAGEDGKGRSVWLSCGYLLATGECEVIALHDCDIRNYERGFVARLCYPLVHPDLDFEFCKAFYARAGSRMHGRVTRLFMTPLLRALSGMIPGAPLLDFLGSFRYPLAGEFAMKAGLARENRIPGNWGLEVGVLAEVFRNCPAGRTCQVDLADNYEHKHQSLSAEDASKGLRRMTRDIAAALFRALAGEGAAISREQLRALEPRYVRLAEDTMRCYYADAVVNGLEFDRHAEEHAIEAFARSLREAGTQFLAHPVGGPLIPNWNRVLSAIPEFFDLLLDSVHADAGHARMAA